MVIAGISNTTLLLRYIFGRPARLRWLLAVRRGHGLKSLVVTLPFTTARAHPLYPGSAPLVCPASVRTCGISGRQRWNYHSLGRSIFMATLPARLSRSQLVVADAQEGVDAAKCPPARPSRSAPDHLTAQLDRLIHVRTSTTVLLLYVLADRCLPLDRAPYAACEFDGVIGSFSRLRLLFGSRLGSGRVARGLASSGWRVCRLLPQLKSRRRNRRRPVVLPRSQVAPGRLQKREVGPEVIGPAGFAFHWHPSCRPVTWVPLNQPNDQSSTCPPVELVVDHAQHQKLRLAGAQDRRRKDHQQNQQDH